MKVVSLIASATEIVSALGFEKNLVGRSHECDFPPSVRRLPPLTHPQFSIEGSSRDIDRRVKGLLKDAVSVYRVDESLLAKLRPDVIVTQSQCEVCAVSLLDVEKSLRPSLGFKPKIVSLSPNSLADVWKDISRVARALGIAERGQKLIAPLKKRMSRISDKARRINDKPRVACIEWINPLMAAGNWMPELVRLAGGVNLFGKARHHSPWMTWSELVRKDPDVIIVLPCGFDMTRTLKEMPLLTRKPGWKALKAVRENRVYLADGNQYFNRPGPRLAESLEILAEILHPERFGFGHEGRGWLRF